MTYVLQESNETLLVATEKIGREVNGKKPTPMQICCDADIEEYHNIKETIHPFCMGETQKNQKCILK